MSGSVVPIESQSEGQVQVAGRSDFFIRSLMRSGEPQTASERRRIRIELRGTSTEEHTPHCFALFAHAQQPQRAEREARGATHTSDACAPLLHSREQPRVCAVHSVRTEPRGAPRERPLPCAWIATCAGFSRARPPGPGEWRRAPCPASLPTCRPAAKSLHCTGGVHRRSRTAFAPHVQVRRCGRCRRGRRRCEASD